MDRLNKDWLKNRPNFYFKYKKRFIESLIEGTCLNIGCGSYLVENALNTDKELSELSYPDNSFDTVVCSDGLEALGAHKQAVAGLMRIARKKIIISVPAYKWLYGEYDRRLGHKRRYEANDFSGFQVTYLFWFLVPVLFLRKLFNLRHRQLPRIIDNLLFEISKLRPGFGTTIIAVKNKISDEKRRLHRVSLFIPIFNEEKIIDRDIRAVDYVVGKMPQKTEIFIVNDASSDKTAQIAGKIEKSNKRVTLLNYSLGPSRRENLAQSFKQASGDIIAFLDIDLVGSLRFYQDLIDEVLAGSDIVTGSRYACGSKIRRKPFRLLISKAFNGVIRTVFKTGIKDHLCGFKAFRKEAILSLVEEMGYDRSLRRGVFWDTEMLIRARHHGYKIKEIPIWWRERKKSALYFKREVRSLLYIADFFFKFRHGKGQNNK